MVGIIITCFVIAILVGGFYLWFFSPTQIGKRGEKKVNKILSSFSDSTLLSNYLIVDSNNKSHQIDSILVNRAGVFVIETKNYSGRIYGDDKSTHWTQTLKYGKIKNKFYSPVKQNLTHVLNLKDVLPVSTPLYSIIVFCRNNTEYIKSEYTLPIKKLKRKIESYKATLNDEEVSKIIDILNAKRNVTMTNREHVKNIRETQKEIKENICPRCGGKLVLRESKNGKFYGCENYPKCRFKKKIDE